MLIQGETDFLNFCFVIGKLEYKQVSEKLKTGELVDNLRAFTLSWCFNKKTKPFRIPEKSL